MSKKHYANLTAEQKDAIAGRLLNLKYELLPLSNALPQAEFLPDGALVSVTASPAKGMMATVDLSLELQQRGFDVIPHLSARLHRDRAELRDVIKRLDDAGVTKAFIVGGDADPPGEFFDALTLILAMEDEGHPFTSLGITGYPEGHHFIGEDEIDQALLDKAPYAEYSTTQMCFTPETIVSWIHRQRSRGIELPIYLGIPGVAELRKLIGISARIGVGDSVKFLTKNTSLVGKLVRPGGYSPDALIAGLADALLDPTANITGFHCYTFNQVETTERWRQQMLEALV